MAERDGNEFWRSWTNYQSFELRAHRFRPEMLPVFCAWLGIRPDSRVLDAGCGSGVFTRYLAGVLADGYITGFDINETFVAYGNARLAALSLADRARLEVQDGYALSYPDGAFDAVTNYTYVGVLSDPEAGLGEMIRVCTPGGTVSCVVASNAFPRAGYQGDFPFDPEGELPRLAWRENRIFSALSGDAAAGRPGEWSLMKRLGLKDIRMYPFAHLICFSDAGLPLADRRALALDETREEIGWLRSRFEERAPEYEKRGFTRADFDRQTALLEMKLAYYESHFEDNDAYEWQGGFNYIVAGIKERNH